jgi:hypothetical protein
MIKEAAVEDDEIKIMSDEAHQQWLDLNAERDALKKRAEAMKLSSDCFRAAATVFQKERDAARAEVCFQKANIEFLDKEVTRRRKENEEQAGEIGRLRNALAFKRNVIIDGDYEKAIGRPCRFEGRWIAVPEEDFDEAQAALRPADRTADYESEALGIMQSMKDEDKRRKG